jgi:hypothetical protein
MRPGVEAVEAGVEAQLWPRSTAENHVESKSGGRAPRPNLSQKFGRLRLVPKNGLSAELLAALGHLQKAPPVEPICYSGSSNNANGSNRNSWFSPAGTARRF